MDCRFCYTEEERNLKYGIGSIITDVEYHPETGERLTIWLRRADGLLVYIVPTDPGFKLLSTDDLFDECIVGSKVTAIVREKRFGRYEPYLISIHLQSPDGRMTEITPNHSESELYMRECQWAEEFHGGKR